MRVSVGLSTLSKLDLISRNREDTFRRGLCGVFTSLTRVRQASYVLSPGREPHWLRWIRPFERATRRRRAAIILSRIFETVRRRTVILKEEGDTYDGLPGLSRTTPFATCSEAVWYPRETSGERIWRRIAGLLALTHFQVRYGIPSGPGADEEEDLERAWAISSFMRGGVEWCGLSLGGGGEWCFGREEMAQECLIYLLRGLGPGEGRKTGWRSA